MKMKIALISYEYPPDAAYGGISTYTYQAARMLHVRGHHVEVFTSSPYRCGTETEDGIIVHRINEKSEDFPTHIGTLFAQRHTSIQFDVVEGPEYKADAREAIRLVPDIPLVVKLHAPSFLIHQISHYRQSLYERIYQDLRAVRWGNRDRYLVLDWVYKPESDVEYVHTLSADVIATPSKDLGKRITKSWRLEPEKVFHVPNLFEASQELLSIPVDTITNVVSFIGRLEPAKGVLDFAQAIPSIVQQCPNTKFRFIGRFSVSSLYGDMRQYLEKKLHNYRNTIEFASVSPSEIPMVLAKTDICVFPSVWENFPYVCLEAMAAGCGVVGSSSGGMAEMLTPSTGRLVPPRSPQKITKAVVELLKSPELRMKMGEAARTRLLEEYNFAKIGALQEESYNEAILRRKAIGSRCIEN